MNVLSTIALDISSCLVGLSVALMLATIFLVNARSHIDSLLICIESFCQELQQEGQYYTNEDWLLANSCFTYNIKQLRKVRVPAQTTSDMASTMDRAGATL